MSDAKYDPNQSVWRDNSTCRCQNAFGMKCSAWCTDKIISGFSQAVVRLEKNYSTDFKDQLCPDNQNIISCQIMGNKNGTLSRDQVPRFFPSRDGCRWQGIKDDQFEMTCLTNSDWFRISQGTFSPPTMNYYSCSVGQGRLISCAPTTIRSPTDRAFIANSTTCECQAYKCFAVCVKSLYLKIY